MVSVFVWPGLPKGNVGHAALEIAATGALPRQYLSWWPAGAGGFVAFLTDRTIPATTHTFDEDEEAEEFANFHTITFSLGDLDEDAMRAWWARWQTDATYRLFHKNCATTVGTALAVGNRERTGPADSAWTPFGVWMYARQLWVIKKLLGQRKF